MMLNKNSNRKRENIPLRLGAGIIINILIISSIIFLLDYGSYSDYSASGWDSERIVLDPGDFSELQYSNEASAYQQTNSLLQNMTMGNISILDNNDDDFTSRFVRNYAMGLEIFWEFSDNNVTVYINAETGKIEFYNKFDWQSGSLTESQIENQALSIAQQFDTLPSDRTNPYTTNDASLYFGCTNLDTSTETNTEYPYWEVAYYRTKDSILCQDSIHMVLLPNGYLLQYYRDWNMNLDGFSTSYSVSKSEAEQIASNFVEGTDSIEDSYKRILRPNKEFSGEEISYGENPKCVWVVEVKDNEDNLWIICISGNSPATIVGGDYVNNYYYT